jgi:hypothetical protein
MGTPDIDYAAVATAAVVAGFTAVGFFGRTIWDSIQASKKEGLVRRKRLLDLSNLLKASSEAFKMQVGLRNRLLALLEMRSAPGLDQEGYDRILAAAFPSMTEEERDLHMIIRASTRNVLKPLNEHLLAWVREEDYFRVVRDEGEAAYALPKALTALEHHLLFWLSKYEAWLPERPERCLVYTGDETEHGFPFPVGLDALVQEQWKKYK